MVRRALITGASSGIGAATARALSDEGYDVWLTYTRGKSGALDVAEACGRSAGRARVSHLDLRQPASITALIEEVLAEWGYLHVVVNNGGVCPYRAYDAIELDEWDEVLETNVRGTFVLSRAALALLREAKSQGDEDRCIINISSVAGQVGSLTTGFHYAASKGAVLALTRSFARVLAAEGIRVNAVAPGPVTSGITDNLSGSERASLAASVPLGRFGDADEVAWVIASLAAPRASFITGATYDVNGGTRMD